MWIGVKSYYGFVIIKHNSSKRCSDSINNVNMLCSILLFYIITAVFSLYYFLVKWKNIPLKTIKHNYFSAGRNQLI